MLNAKVSKETKRCYNQLLHQLLLEWMLHVKESQRDRLLTQRDTERSMLESRASEYEQLATKHSNDRDKVENEAKFLSSLLLKDVEHQRDCLKVAASIQEKSAEILSDKFQEVGHLKQALRRRTMVLNEIYSCNNTHQEASQLEKHYIETHHLIHSQARDNSNQPELITSITTRGPVLWLQSDRKSQRLGRGKWEPVEVVEAVNIVMPPALLPSPPHNQRSRTTVGMKLEGLTVTEIAPNGPAALSSQIAPGMQHSCAKSLTVM